MTLIDNVCEFKSDDVYCYELPKCDYKKGLVFKNNSVDTVSLVVAYQNNVKNGSTCIVSAYDRKPKTFSKKNFKHVKFSFFGGIAKGYALKVYAITFGLHLKWTSEKSPNGKFVSSGSVDLFCDIDPKRIGDFDEFWEKCPLKEKNTSNGIVLSRERFEKVVLTILLNELSKTRYDFDFVWVKSLNASQFSLKTDFNAAVKKILSNFLEPLGIKTSHISFDIVKHKAV